MNATDLVYLFLRYMSWLPCIIWGRVGEERVRGKEEEEMGEEKRVDKGLGEERRGVEEGWGRRGN